MRLASKTTPPSELEAPFSVARALHKKRRRPVTLSFSLRFSAYLCDLCVKRALQTQRSQRYAENRREIFDFSCKARREANVHDVPIASDLATAHLFVQYWKNKLESNEGDAWSLFRERWMVTSKSRMLSFKVAAKTSCSSRILGSVIRTPRIFGCSSRQSARILLEALEPPDLAISVVACLSLSAQSLLSHLCGPVVRRRRSP
jgi:hypothetical protein